MVDLGITLFEIVGETPAHKPDSPFEVTSLMQVMNKPSVNWNEDRIIVTESAWPQWRGISQSRFAARKGHYLFVYDQDLKIYNTLIDRNETNPLPETDPLAKELSIEITQFFTDQGLTPWSPPDHQIIDKLYIGRRIFPNRSTGKLVSNAIQLSKETVLG
ncbi:MAG: hypothetical protein R2827_11545 [Bdellovibrionales bacterium]